MPAESAGGNLSGQHAGLVLIAIKNSLRNSSTGCFYPFFGFCCANYWVLHGNLGEEQLGGASADAQSYWQGRFAACTFVGDFLGISRTRNSWGVAPNPTRDRRKGTKSPLDPFSRLSWSRFHAPSACSFLVLRLSPCLLPQLSAKNQKTGYDPFAIACFACTPYSAASFISAAA